MPSHTVTLLDHKGKEKAVDIEAQTWQHAAKAAEMSHDFSHALRVDTHVTIAYRCSRCGAYISSDEKVSARGGKVRCFDCR